MVWTEASAFGVERRSIVGRFPSVASAQSQLPNLIGADRRHVGAILVELASVGVPIRSFEGSHILPFYLMESGGQFVDSRPVPFRSVWEDENGLLQLQPQTLGYLPFRPLWIGFGTNTVIYSMVLGLLIAGPIYLRRLLRRKRGLCAACAYPAGDSPVCTECGASLRIAGVA
jgi:hypothetical protein